MRFLRNNGFLLLAVKVLLGPSSQAPASLSQPPLHSLKLRVPCHNLRSAINKKRKNYVSPQQETPHHLLKRVLLSVLQEPPLKIVVISFTMSGPPYCQEQKLAIVHFLFFSNSVLE